MPEITTNAREEPGRQNITFITLLRAIASLMVVWCHLVAAWTIHHQVTFAPLEITRPWLIQPLAIIQDSGFLGVAIFFFVSGFIITHVAQRETQLAFFIKRVLRIYPPLILSCIVIAILLRVSIDPLDESGSIADRTFAQFLRAMTLMNYFAKDNHYVNPVAWTLVIETLFYAMTFLALPLMRWSATASTLLLAALCWSVVLRAHDLGDNLAAVSVSTGMIPLLLIGQSTYWIWIGRIKAWQFGLLLLANWFVFACALGSMYIDKLPPTNSYGVSALYAYLMFVVAMLANDRLRLPRWITFYATISYSLYLLHTCIGETLLTTLAPKFGYAWVIGPVFGVVTLASYLSWRFVEQPSQLAARELLRLFKSASFTGAINRSAAVAIAAVVLMACVTLLAIHPNERLPLNLFLMPGQLYPSAQAADAAPPPPDAATPSSPPPSSAAPAATQAAAVSDQTEGSFDAADQNALTGWAWDAMQPNVPIAVEIEVDEKFGGKALADQFREDLLAAGKGDGRHGFYVRFFPPLGDGNSHTVSIKIAGTTHELYASPKTVPASTPSR